MAITVQQGAELLNQTLSEMGYDYQIDTTSNETIESGFKQIGVYPPDMRSNILNMAVKILTMRVYTSMFDESKNPMRRFWKNAIDYGGGVQEIFLKLVEAENGFWAGDFSEDSNWGGYGSEEALSAAIAHDLVSFKKDDTINKIHVITDKFRIKISLSDLEFTKVFTPNGFADFVNAKYANMQQSAEAKLMEIGISVAKQMVSDKRIIFKTGFSLNNENDVTNVVESIKATNMGMSGLTDMYNFDRVKTTSDTSEIYLMITPEFLARLETRGYANAFNLEEYRIKNRLIILPAGTEIGVGPNGRQIGAVLIDRKAVTLAVRYWEVQPFRVANTDYMNSFLKVQLITGYTEFFNAVAFETGDLGAYTTYGYATIGINPSLATNSTMYINGVQSLVNGRIGEYNYPAFVDTSTNKIVAYVPVGSAVSFDKPVNVKMALVSVPDAKSEYEVTSDLNANAQVYINKDTNYYFNIK